MLSIVAKTHIVLTKVSKTIDYNVLSPRADASNTRSSPPLVSYTEFYNDALDHLDLLKEYQAWQIPGKHASFSYCQYPFMLSIVAKRQILTKVSNSFSN